MYKPKSLRDHLEAAIPDLKKNPDKLLVFADEGSVAANGTKSLSFEYRYKLNIIITDYAGESDAVMVPLLAWVHIHQCELVDHPNTSDNGIAFDVDFNNHKTIDLSITLQLTERVVVKKLDGGKLEIKSIPEPQPTPEFDSEFWTLYQGDTLLAEWHTPTSTS